MNRYKHILNTVAAPEDNGEEKDCMECGAERHCMECGRRIVGRKGKRFCSETCRTSYHNSANSIKYAGMRKTNSILKRNYDILERRCHNMDEESHCHITDLITEGFDVHYHTSIKRIGRQTIIFCYDYSYTVSRNGIVHIEKNL